MQTISSLLHNLPEKTALILLPAKSGLRLSKEREACRCGRGTGGRGRKAALRVPRRGSLNHQQGNPACTSPDPPGRPAKRPRPPCRRSRNASEPEQTQPNTVFPAISVFLISMFSSISTKSASAPLARTPFRPQIPIILAGFLVTGFMASTMERLLFRL